VCVRLFLLWISFSSFSSSSDFISLFALSLEIFLVFFLQGCATCFELASTPKARGHAGAASAAAGKEGSRGLATHAGDVFQVSVLIWYFKCVCVGVFLNGGDSFVHQICLIPNHPLIPTMRASVRVRRMSMTNSLRRCNVYLFFFSHVFLHFALSLTVFERWTETSEAQRPSLKFCCRATGIPSP